MKTVLIQLGLLLFSTTIAQAQTPPPLCKPCLFYAGDSDEFDPDAEIFANEFTLGYGAGTYSAITVPKGRTALIEGILFQVMQVVPPDPKGASWDIRINVPAGGGSSIASGSGPVVMQPTGRFFNQYSEYTTVVQVKPPVQITGGSNDHGTLYWFNLTPVCLNQRDQACGQDQYFVSNTPHEANGFHALLQQGGAIFINYPQENLNWENVCQAYGLNGNQCAWLSFGLLGKVLN